MRYFVTGGSGFLGSHLIRVLVAAGDEVTALVYEPDREEEVKSFGAATVVGSLQSDAVIEGIRGCDAVFHVAGFVSLDARDRKRSHEVNVDGARAICEAALQAGIPRLVHSSSLVTIGGTRDGVVLHEGSPFETDELQLPYLQTKREGERLALEYNQRGMEVIVCNPCGLIGPQDIWGSAANDFFSMYLRNKIPVVPRVRNNWGDVRDVAIGHQLAMRRGRPGERYFLGCINTTMHDLLQRLDQADGQPVKSRFTLPESMTHVTGWISDLLRLPSPITRDAAKFMQYAFWVSHEKASRELGYDPRPIERSLADSVEWFRRQA